MINFEILEKNITEIRESFLCASPFEHIILDNFCNEKDIQEALMFIPDARGAGYNKSNDYIFAKNKFEKADFDLLCPQFAELKRELLSQRFATWLSSITNQELFVDAEFHGGGLHQGGEGSFLDMHADFNYHPENRSWFRNVNILLYLNKNWEPSYGGQLKLVDGREKNGKPYLITPIFNRAVIMFTREHTLHGYDPINFPAGTYRNSIAAYGYTETGKAGKLRTTVWKPEKTNIFKRFLGKHMPKIVSVKSYIFGSGTRKNK